jgi:hypothetical protein
MCEIHVTQMILNTFSFRVQMLLYASDNHMQRACALVSTTSLAFIVCSTLLSPFQDCVGVIRSTDCDHDRRLQFPGQFASAAASCLPAYLNHKLIVKYNGQSRGQSIIFEFVRN